MQHVRYQGDGYFRNRNGLSYNHTFAYEGYLEKLRHDASLVKKGMMSLDEYADNYASASYEFQDGKLVVNNAESRALFNQIISQNISLASAAVSEIRKIESYKWMNSKRSNFTLVPDYTMFRPSGEITGLGKIDFIEKVADNATPWMKVAEGEIGVTEISGDSHNQSILDYFKSTTYLASTDDDPNEWCSAFVNWCLTEVGINGTNDVAAKSWINYGKPINSYQYGAITILERNGNYHVGFAEELGENYLKVLGGNQGSPARVKYSNFKLESFNIIYILPY